MKKHSTLALALVLAAALLAGCSTQDTTSPSDEIGGFIDRSRKIPGMR